MKRKHLALLLLFVVLVTSCSRRAGNIVSDSFTGITVNYQLLGWKKNKKTHKLYPIHLRSKVTGTSVNSEDFVKVTLQIALANSNRQNVKVYWKKELGGANGYITQLIYSGKEFRYDVALAIPYVRGQNTASYLIVFEEGSPYPVFVSPKITMKG